MAHKEFLNDLKKVLHQSESSANPNTPPNCKAGKKEKKPNFRAIIWKSIVILSSFAVGIIGNKVSNFHWSWYIPAITICVFIVWGVWNLFWGRIASIAICILVVFFTHKLVEHESEFAPPYLTKSVIQLFDGQWFETTPVTVINPNPIPIYSVGVHISIIGKGVSVTSILMPEDLTQKSGGPVAPSALIFNDGNTGVIYIDEIPANGNRKLRFTGTIPIKSSADLSINNDFKTNGEVQFYPGGDFTMTNPPIIH